MFNNVNPPLKVGGSNHLHRVTSTVSPGVPLDNFGGILVVYSPPWWWAVQYGYGTRDSQRGGANRHCVD